MTIDRFDETHDSHKTAIVMRMLRGLGITPLLTEVNLYAVCYDCWGNVKPNSWFKFDEYGGIWASAPYDRKYNHITSVMLGRKIERLVGTVMYAIGVKDEKLLVITAPADAAHRELASKALLADGDDSMAVPTCRIQLDKRDHGNLEVVAA